MRDRQEPMSVGSPRAVRLAKRCVRSPPSATLGTLAAACWTIPRGVPARRFESVSASPGSPPSQRSTSTIPAIKAR